MVVLVALFEVVNHDCIWRACGFCCKVHLMMRDLVTWLHINCCCCCLLMWCGLLQALSFYVLSENYDATSKTKFFSHFYHFFFTPKTPTGPYLWLKHLFQTCAAWPQNAAHDLCWNWNWKRIQFMDIWLKENCICGVYDVSGELVKVKCISSRLPPEMMLGSSLTDHRQHPPLDWPRLAI